MSDLIFSHIALWSASFIYMVEFYAKEMRANSKDIEMAGDDIKPMIITAVFIVTVIMSAIFSFFWFIFNPIVHPWIIKRIDELGF